MKPAKHTPGPWRAMAEEADSSFIKVRGTVLGARFKIANVLTPIYEGAAPLEAEETRANARLIAAAPELLEALRRCRFDSLNMSLADLEFCSAAYAKATGEAS